MNRRTLIRFTVPAAAIAALGGLATIQADHDRRVHEATAKIQQDASVFRDADVLQLAQQTAFTSTARARAPHVTGHMDDAQLHALGGSICADLTRGVDADELRLHDSYPSVPAGEVSAVIRAAHAAYCSDASLSTVRLDAETR